MHGALETRPGFEKIRGARPEAEARLSISLIVSFVNLW